MSGGTSVLSDADPYGPVVLTGDGRSLRPGDDGFEQAQSHAIKYEPPPLNLADAEFGGWTWGGRVFLSGEGEVSIERFNEVMGGPMGNGYSVSFHITDDDDDAD